MPPVELPEELPEGYYLDNFEYLLGFVHKKYSALLTGPETEFVGRFLSLHVDARKLYVRLINRKGPAFRLDKLQYDEIDLVSAIEELKRADFLVGEPPLEIETALGLLTKNELLRLNVFGQARPPASTRRRKLEQMVLEHMVLEHKVLATRDSTDIGQEDTSFSPLVELGISTVEPMQQDIVQLFKLLFFGNFHQDMTEFVLHELVAPFETYELSEEHNLFTDRKIVDEAILLHSLGDLSHDLIAADETGEFINSFLREMPCRHHDPMLGRRYDRIVNRLGRHLERMGENTAAVEVYQLAVATPSRERRARLSAKENLLVESLSICQEIAEAPLDEDEYEFAIKFARKLARKHDLSCEFTTEVYLTRSDTIPTQNISIPRHPDCVELGALQWYLDNGMDGFYVENTLIRSMFGLVFWDIIFAPLKGVFFNPFQRGPADLYTPDFVIRRESLIQARLEELKDRTRFHQLARHHFEVKRGISNHFVNWMVVDKNLLTQSLDKIPVEDFTVIFDRLLSDLKSNGSGLPDLIVFDDDGYTLVEVKGPGDRLQKNQTRWFNFFLAQNLPAHVVNVEYIDVEDINVENTEVE